MCLCSGQKITITRATRKCYVKSEIRKNIAGYKNVVLKICLENGEGIGILTNECSCF